MTDKPNPYPTPTRVRFAEGVAADQVRYYPWRDGLAIWTDEHHRESTVSALVREFRNAGLAGLVDVFDREWKRVVLTPAGAKWLDRAKSGEQDRPAKNLQEGDLVPVVDAEGNEQWCKIVGHLDILGPIKVVSITVERDGEQVRLPGVDRDYLVPSRRPS